MKKGLIAVFVTLCLSLFSFAQNGTWTGVLDVQGYRLPLVFHLDGDKPTMDSPDQGARGIPIEIATSEPGKLIINIPMLGAKYEGEIGNETITGIFTQRGASFPLDLLPGEQKLNRPQTPQPPFPYSKEEVTFKNGDALLKGTLVLPEGYDRKTPVLLMVTGSGLQNRDEEIFDHKPFAVIADAFARAGIATLRYDDRGFGESTGDIINSTTEDFKNDALAGIQLLRERFDNVGVLGHSEGGTIAFMLAAEEKIDFMISLAGMIVSGAETLTKQNEDILAKTGYSKEIIDAYCGLLNDAFEAVREGKPLPSAESVTLPEELKKNYIAVATQLQSPYLTYFVSLDIRPMLKKINCPVLALNGTKDTQVDYETNLESLCKSLPKTKNNRIESVEGLNHLFQHCTTGSLEEYKQIEETFSPEVLNLMIEWIKEIE